MEVSCWRDWGNGVVNGLFKPTANFYSAALNDGSHPNRADPTLRDEEGPTSTKGCLGITSDCPAIRAEFKIRPFLLRRLGLNRADLVEEGLFSQAIPRDPPTTFRIPTRSS